VKTSNRARQLFLFIFTSKESFVQNLFVWTRQATSPTKSEKRSLEGKTKILIKSLDYSPWHYVSLQRFTSRWTSVKFHIIRLDRPLCSTASSRSFIRSHIIWY